MFSMFWGCARTKQLAWSKHWMRTTFSSQADGADWNTPRKYRTTTPTAASGKKNGLKRKAEFESVSTEVWNRQVKALTN